MGIMQDNLCHPYISTTVLSDSKGKQHNYAQDNSKEKRDALGGIGAQTLHSRQNPCTINPLYSLCMYSLV